MLTIYLNMSFNFLIQATRVLNGNSFDEDELKMVTDYVLSLDNDILKDYFNTCTILSYDNDLELYIEILDIESHWWKFEPPGCRIDLPPIQSLKHLNRIDYRQIHMASAL